MSILSMTAVELSKKIKEKEISVKEAVQASLDQVEAGEKKYNCYVTVDPEGALAQAEAIQKKIDDGELTGPLAGVPMAVKDNICTKGLKTTCSSKILYNFVPPYDAEAADHLKKAGAVILGKTNMDEFAMGSTTETSAFGATKNPWNTEHVGRLLWRFLQRGSGKRVLCGPWLRYWRIDPSAQFLLRCNRTKANIWNGIPLRTHRLRFLSGSDRTGSEGCSGLCRYFGCDRRS